MPRTRPSFPAARRSSTTCSTPRRPASSGCGSGSPPRAMVFSSLTFVCLFLPLVGALYLVLPRSASNPLLVVASLVFYGWGEPRALVLVALSVLVNFRLGLLLDAATGSRRRHLITAAVALNLLVLVVFKYAGFLVENVNALVGAISAYQLPEPRISLPFGISFFTFHLISYL